MYWQTLDDSLRSRVRRVVGLAVVLAALSTTYLWFWYEKETDPTHFVAAANELPIPASWPLAHEKISGDLLFGISVTRYYLVDADSPVVAESIEQVATSLGYRVDPDWFPLSCRRNQSFATTGPQTCTLAAMRDNNHLFITVLDRGERASYFVGMDSHFVSAPDMSVLILSVSDRR